MKILKIIFILLLTASAPMFASVAYVQSGFSAPNGPSATITLGSSVTSGDLLVCAAAWTNTGGALVAPTDTLSTSFVSALPFAYSFANSNGGQNLYVWLGFAPSSGTDTITFNPFSASGVSSCIEYSGVTTTILVGSQLGNSVTTAVFTSGNVPNWQTYSNTGLMLSIGEQYSPPHVVTNSSVNIRQQNSSFNNSFALYMGDASYTGTLPASGGYTTTYTSGSAFYSVGALIFLGATPTSGTSQTSYGYSN